jgi:hypothetical protein
MVSSEEKIMTTVHHGFNLQAIRTELNRADWEDDAEEPGLQVRRLYLGSVLSLTPSGKFYTPFACSNVDACKTCKGTTRVVARRHKRRTQKKQAGRHARILRRFEALYGSPDTETGLEPSPSLAPRYRPTASERRAAYAFIDRQPKAYRSRYLRVGATCTACGGLGSREAYLDELWNEAAEEAISSIEGCYLEWVDGDAFACESRDAEESDENEEESENATA